MGILLIMKVKQDDLCDFGNLRYLLFRICCCCLLGVIGGGLGMNDLIDVLSNSE